MLHLEHYNKYIITRIVGPLILITFSLTCVVWLTQALRFIDLIVNRGLNVSTFLYLSVLLLPSLMGIILPIALLISIIVIYNRLSLDSELVVLKSAGLSRLSIIKPAAIVALGTALFGYIISLYLLPASYREFKDMQSFIRDNYIAVLLQEGVFNTPVKGLTVYIREIHENGQLKGILVHDNRSLEKPITMMAEEGTLKGTSTGPRFLLVNGNRQQVNFETGQLSLLYFERYAIDLNDFTQATQTRWREPEERYLSELFNPEKTTRVDLRQKLIAEGHHRLTWPLYSILMALIGLVPFVLGEFNRRGQAKRIFFTTAAGLGFLGVALSFKNIIAANPGLTTLMYLVIFGSIAGCSWLLLKESRTFFWPKFDFKRKTEAR
jgi:lipopolysaccharide export system permease protein